jgi:MSHA pilin protein MshA
MKKIHSGFTLIELIIVIVILGVFAVTAAPRFIDISSDARIAELTALGGSIKSASNLVYAKAVIQGIEKQALGSTGFIDLDGDGSGDILIHYGYPNSGDPDVLEQIVDMEEYMTHRIGYGTPTPVLYVANKTVASNYTALLAANCYLTYARSVSLGEFPVITYVTSGC